YTFAGLQRPLEEALRRRGIPFRAEIGGLFSRPEVRDALAYLRAAADREDDPSWLRVAQNAVHRLPDAACAGAAFARTAGRPLVAEVLAALAVDATAPADWRRRATGVLATVDRLGALADRRPAIEVVSAAMQTTGLLRHHEARARGGDVDGRRALAALRQLYRLCATAQRPGTDPSLASLLVRLAALDEEDRTAEPPAASDEDAVTLLTIHRAKGLEFAFVVLADARPYQQRPGGAVVWDEAQQAVVQAGPSELRTAAHQRWRAGGGDAGERAERRRVLYVGLTRARDGLLVTRVRGRRGPTAGLDGVHQLAPAPPAADPAADPVDIFGELAGRLSDPQGPVAAWDPGPPATGPIGADAAGAGPAATGTPAALGALGEIGARWTAVVAAERAAAVRRARAPQRAPLSFTTLVELQSCPRRYRYRFVEAWPPTDAEGSSGPPLLDGSTDGRGLGIAVHAALAAAHAARPEVGAPGAAALLAELDRITPQLAAADRARAEAMLAGYADLPVAALPTWATELRFEWRWHEDPALPPIHGAIDRVARAADGAWWILDYKTHRQLDGAAVERYGHQLRLYAMAMQAGLGAEPQQPMRAVLVDLRRAQVLEVTLDPAALAATRAWASGAATRLAARGFAVGTGFPDRPCAGCGYRSCCPERRRGPAVSGGPAA
ncbi:MAG TPA: ATP-dependent DNA helicase, partial [Candidatus Dormibacteraeota bacterium]|nr:ATP-dependent DNA helicase [Candidatus Dormibacteraeota bacterium]